MREIKFRAWDADTKEMVKHEHLAVVAGEAAYILEGNMGSLVSSFREDLILMQFTGLLDSKGVDIYEGDIVRCDINGEALLYLCQWTDECSGFELRGIAPYVDMSWLIADVIEESTIIGNIYEDKELIK